MVIARDIPEHVVGIRAKLRCQAGSELLAIEPHRGHKQFDWAGSGVTRGVGVTPGPEMRIVDHVLERVDWPARYVVLEEQVNPLRPGTGGEDVS